MDIYHKFVDMNKALLYLLFIGFFMVSCEDAEPVKQSPKSENLDSLILAFPDSVPLLIKHGAKMISEYEYEKALADAAKAFRLDSNNIEARMLYAEVLNNKPGKTVADVAAAQRHYKIIVNKEPKNTKALVGLAASYRQQMDFEATFKYVNEALRIDPKCRDAYVLKGSTYVFLKDLKLAKSSYETAVQQDPNFFEAYIMLGSIYQGEGDKLCLQYYTTALQLKPNDMDAIYALAYAEHLFGNLEEAKTLYRKMAGDTSEFYVARGLFHQGYIKQFSDQSIDSAIYYYNSALETSPMHVESWYNLGICYMEEKENTKALQSFSKTLKYARQQGYNDDFIKQVEDKAKQVKLK